jgi:putative ABC transport system substrate-binding protein
MMPVGGLVVALLALAAPLALGAPHAGKIHRIGLLEIAGAASNAAYLDAFRRGLAEHGYVEGQNLVIEYRSADGRPERFSDLATELVRLEVDVLVTRGTPATLAAKRATQTIPIVMASSGDPVAEGIVASLARPGGNVTGLHIIVPPELGGRRLQLLKEIVPGSSRIGILWNPGDLYTPLLVKNTERAARAMGVQLESLAVQRSGPFEQVFETALFGRVDALITVEDYLTFTYRARILDFAAMSRLPAIYGLREFVDDGGLMSYGTDRRDLYRRSATYVHRILTGARPADLPVEPPLKFELAINLKTARALRLAVPPALLQRADHIVH